MCLVSGFVRFTLGFTYTGSGKNEGGHRNPVDLRTIVQIGPPSTPSSLPPDIFMESYY